MYEKHVQRQPSTRQRQRFEEVSYHACDDHECEQKQRVACAHKVEEREPAK